jgi:hypothetical protein
LSGDPSKPVSIVVRKLSHVPGTLMRDNDEKTILLMMFRIRVPVPCY